MAVPRTPAPGTTRIVGRAALGLSACRSASPRLLGCSTGFLLRAFNHAAAGFIVCLREGIPPFGKRRRHVPSHGAKHQEVIASTVAGMLNNAPGRLSGAPLKPGLHEPNIVHVRLIPPLNRKLLTLRFQHINSGFMQRGDPPQFPLLFVVSPALGNLRPQQGSKKKRRRDLFSDSKPFVGAAKRKHEKLFAVGL